jgi:N-acetylmuramoyl-L-alanine amidase
MGDGGRKIGTATIFFKKMVAVPIFLLPLVCLCLACLGGVLYAYGYDGTGLSKNHQELASVAKLRVGRHANYVRLVFETTESNVQKANAGRSAGNSITVDFHSPVSFIIPQKGAPNTYVETGSEDNIKKKVYKIDKDLDITIDPQGCVISLTGLVDINVLRLSQPSRLVIDAYISGEPAASPAASSTFVIDAGHGGYEKGVQFEKIAEKDLSLSFAREIAKTLAGRGMNAILTRKGDQRISLIDRARLANSKSPCLLVSIHVSSRNEFVIYQSVKPLKAADTGSEDPAAMNVSESVAQEIERNIRGSFKTDVRIEKKELMLISYVRVPAVLIELPSPDKFNYDGRSRERIIEGILHAILHAVPGGLQA